MKPKICEVIDEIQAFAPWFGFALHIRQGRPSMLRMKYPEPWRRYYEEGHFALRDPIMAWGLSHDGIRDFSGLTCYDHFGLLERLTEIGLPHGFAVAVGEPACRSLAGFSRSDRPFTSEEKQLAQRLIRKLHCIVAQQAHSLTPAQIEALRLVARGLRHAAAAHRLGITESALKARLKSARLNLGARTTAEAIRLVNAADLIG